MNEHPEAIRRFLDALETDRWDGFDAHLTDDVLLDATVPEWRYQMESRDTVLEEFRGWTAQHPWRVTEARCSPTSDGAVVELEIHGLCPGDDDHGAHEEMSRQALIFSLRDGQIAECRLFCSGEWNEEVMNRIAAEAPKVQRATR